MYITLKELIEKLNKAPKRYGIEIGEEIVTDAWIAGANDRDYPPGTILLECKARNGSSVETPDDTHILSIYPTKLGKIN